MAKNNNTILLVAAAGVAVYLLTKPKAAAGYYPASYYQNPSQYGGQYYSGNPQGNTSNLISAGSQALATLSDSLRDWFT